MPKNYELYHEDDRAYYFKTGRIIGDFFKTEERIAVCKQCGMEYTPSQRHGPVDLENCVPRGITSTGDVCTECGLRTDHALQFTYNEIELVTICPECIQEHHGLNWFTIKYEVIRQLLAKGRNRK